MIFRRTVLLALAALTASPVFAKGGDIRKIRRKKNRPPPPTAAEVKWMERLQRDLDARVVPGFQTAFSVSRVYLSAGDTIEAKAVVCMSWPPGERQRPMLAQAASAETCYAALLAATVETFTSVNPGCLS